MRILPTILPLLLCMACGLLPNKDKTPQAAEKVGDSQARPQASIETKQLAAEKEAETLAEVAFIKGRADFGKAERDRLERVIRKLKEKNVDRVIVAAWSDRTLPGEDGKNLTARDKDLAEKRGEFVRELLRQRGGEKIKIDFHNMAEKPGAISKFLGSEEARIKKSLEGARPSKAIVLVIEIN